MKQMPSDIEQFEGYRRWLTGDWNACTQGRDESGNKTIEIYTERDGRKFKFTIKDLYGPNEQILTHTELDNTMPEHIQKRMARALEISQGNNE
jgi:hypothetical protein